MKISYRRIVEGEAEEDPEARAKRKLAPFDPTDLAFEA